MPVQMVTWYFSTVITIFAQIHICAIVASIHTASYKIIWASVTVERNFKLWWIPYFEQTNISLDINLPFQAILRAPSTCPNRFDFFKITLVALVHFDFSFLYVHLCRECCTYKKRADFIKDFDVSILALFWI